MLGVEGLRGDLVVNRAARAMVAFQGGEQVELDDVEEVLLMCMNHRMRRDPLDPLDNTTKARRPGNIIDVYTLARHMLRSSCRCRDAVAPATGFHM